MKIAGLIFDDSRHYLDHLAPFCALRKWPLIVCEDSIASLAREFYPDLEVIEMAWDNLKLPSTLVTCETRPYLLCAFPQKKLKTLWLPHGNSDKGWKSPFFEALSQEQTVLVYGQKMIDFMEKKKVVRSDLKIERIGNFRLAYYQKHRSFYQNLVQNRFNSTHRTLLYAPTWNDSENNSSFWQAFPILAESLPSHYTLLVKLHPNTQKTSEPEIERLIGKYQNKNILWVSDFPPIYPLLELCDGYIGDMSSIGYDFLSRNRPMYFLNSQKRDPKMDEGLYLFRCGLELLPEDYANLFSIDEKTHSEDAARFFSIRQEIYQYTFDS
ncbi:MAG: CDP-glycerol glycerophosphotransferase family protein [Verrucomicrobia bacterium]|nr:CDP-glycerol glycerophosphotransferase family protein [Verrucomicrobiota bacterium]